MKTTQRKEREPEREVDKTWLEAPRWDKSFRPFGDRLDFLSPESQHATTGKLRILPAKDPKNAP